MKVLETAFKKEYSVVQNAINYLSNEEAIKNCGIKENSFIGITDDCNALKEGLITKLYLEKLPVKTEHHNYGSLLAEKYAKIEEIKLNGGKIFIDAVSYTQWINDTNAYQLKDGSVLFMTPPYFYISNSYSNAVMLFDTNGEKGPNKWGYDVFYLTLIKTNTGTLQLDTSAKYGGLVEKGGRLPKDILMKI